MPRYPFLLQKDGADHYVTVSLDPFNFKATVRLDREIVVVMRARELAKAGREGRQIALPDGSQLSVTWDDKGIVRRDPKVSIDGQVLAIDSKYRRVRRLSGGAVITGVLGVIICGVGGFRWIVVPALVASIAAVASGVLFLKTSSPKALRAVGASWVLMALAALFSEAVTSNLFGPQPSLNSTVGQPSDAASPYLYLGSLLMICGGIYLIWVAGKSKRRPPSLDVPGGVNHPH